MLAAGFSELAAQLGALDLIDPRNPVASVHGVLADYPANWLLVFDNAADRASVRAFLPGGAAAKSDHQPESDMAARPGARRAGADPGVAVSFLVSRTGDPDQSAAMELAIELGGLPLALEQAAAYLQTTGEALADYLALFRQRRADPAGPRPTDRVRQDGRHHLDDGI